MKSENNRLLESHCRLRFADHSGEEFGIQRQRGKQQSRAAFDINYEFARANAGFNRQRK
jgi:hypothetical protein